jgi:hypothetical protein
MQTALHRQLAPMLPQYLPQSLTLNSSRALPNPIVMPTPPVTSRKRKRAHQYTVSYSEVQEVDDEGRVREVIVIEDTPPPSTISPATTHTNVFSTSYQPPVYSAPIRTRARAAAEAQTLSASTSSAAIVAPAPKKRKREPVDDSRAILTKKTAAALQQQPVASTKSWASGSGAATADVRNHRSFYRIASAPCSCFAHRLSMATFLVMIRRAITLLSQMTLFIIDASYPLNPIISFQLMELLSSRSYCSSLGARNLW